MTALVLIAKVEKSSREIVRVVLDHFKRQNLVDIRVSTCLAGCELMPTKKGITVAIKRLPELVSALQQVVVEADVYCRRRWPTNEKKRQQDR